MFTLRAKELIDKEFPFSKNIKNHILESEFHKINLIEDFIEEENSAYYIAKCSHKKYVIDFFFKKLSKIITIDGLTEYGKSKFLEFEEKISRDENEFEYDYEFDQKMGNYFWHIISLIDGRYDILDTGIKVQESSLRNFRIKKGKFANLFNVILIGKLCRRSNIIGSIDYNYFCGGNKYISWFFKKFIDVYGDILTKKELRNQQLFYHLISCQITSHFKIITSRTLNCAGISKIPINNFKEFKTIAKEFYQLCKK